MNRPRLSLHQRLSRTAQATACACVTLLLLLSWLAVDPAAHAWLHGHEKHSAKPDNNHCAAHACHNHHHASSTPATEHQDEEDDSMCVVTAFAGGAPGIGAAPLSIHFSPVIVIEETLRDLERIAVVQAAKHPPSCGPPGAV